MAITNALLVAGFLMLVHNPKILIFDPSFQLSFLATVGLIYFAPPIAERISFITERYQIREVFSATIATQIFVLPLLLYMMGEMSIVALPVNLLILITIPLTMLLGFLVATIGLVSTLLSLPFAYAAYFLLSYDLAVVDLFASIPFSSITVGSFPVWLMLGVYGLYLFVMVKNVHIPDEDGAQYDNG